MVCIGSGRMEVVVEWKWWWWKGDGGIPSKKILPRIFKILQAFLVDSKIYVVRKIRSFKILTNLAYFWLRIILLNL